MPPGRHGPDDPADYLRAVELAEITVQWAESLVGLEPKT